MNDFGASPVIKALHSSFFSLPKSIDPAIDTLLCQHPTHLASFADITSQDFDAPDSDGRGVVEAPVSVLGFGFGVFKPITLKRRT